MSYDAGTYKLPVATRLGDSQSAVLWPASLFGVQMAEVTTTFDVNETWLLAAAIVALLYTWYCKYFGR